jgi:hypothetical protein
MGSFFSRGIRKRKEGLAMSMSVKIGLFCLLGGLCFTISAMGAGHFGWWYLSGVLTVAALLPVVRFGPRGMVAQGATMFVILLLIGLVCTLSEGVVFFPEKKAQMMAGLVGGSVLYLIAAVVLTVLAKLLKLHDGQEPAIERRSFGMAISMILLAAFSYLVYYEIFGALTFQFFTKGYYPHAVEQVSAMGAWFFGYQIARGLVMTLAVLPVIYTLRLPRLQAALIVGLLVWVVGGAAPLLVPNEMMGATQRYIHIGEIFTQNFLLGVTATLLVRPRKSAAVATPMHSAVV